MVVILFEDRAVCDATLEFTYSNGCVDDGLQDARSRTACRVSCNCSRIICHNKTNIICSNFILFKSRHSSLSKANLRCHFGLREETVTFIQKEKK